MILKNKSKTNHSGVLSIILVIEFCICWRAKKLGVPFVQYEVKTHVQKTCCISEFIAI